MKNLIASELKNAGFGTRLYANGIYVYLRNRNIDTMEAIAALGEISDFVNMRTANDPHRWNRQGVMITGV